VVDLNRWLRKNDQGDMGALKLTTQKFYRVNGGSTQLEGVKSDVVMPDRYSYFDVGERDYDNPLPYDKISPASYNLWEGYIDYQATVAKSKLRIAQNNQLKLIEQNAMYIKARRDQMDVTLNLTAYSKQIDENKQAIKKFDSLDTYDNKLSYRSLADELVLMREDTTLVEKRKRWHKNLTKDVYLEEAISVLQDLKLASVSNRNTSKMKN
jgi:carboxyl-terminal processing protease